MLDHKMYGKLIFYFKACISGSMFENILPDYINIYATTAAKPTESSYACYCDEPGFDTCLGDEYSVAWLDNSDSHDLAIETLKEQFKYIVEHTTKSHPQQYGQKSIASLNVGQFHGEKASSGVHARRSQLRDSVDSRDGPLVILGRKIDDAAVLIKELQTLIAGRRILASGIEKIISQLCFYGYCSDAKKVMSTQQPLMDHSAYSKVVYKFQSNCLNLGIHTHGMKFMYAFANLVQLNNFTDSTLYRFLVGLEKACKNLIIDHGFESFI